MSGNFISSIYYNSESITILLILISAPPNPHNSQSFNLIFINKVKAVSHFHTSDKLATSEPFSTDRTKTNYSNLWVKLNKKIKTASSSNATLHKVNITSSPKPKRSP